MNNPIQFGNLQKKTKDHNGWVLGHFIAKTDPLHCDDLEVKYYLAKKGERNESSTAKSKGSTISFLIRGKFKLIYPEYHAEYVLEKEGDFVFCGPDIMHDWEVLEDCLLITIRWPSKTKLRT